MSGHFANLASGRMVFVGAIGSGRAGSLGRRLVVAHQTTQHFRTEIESEIRPSVLRLWGLGLRWFAAFLSAKNSCHYFTRTRKRQSFNIGRAAEDLPWTIWKNNERKGNFSLHFVAEIFHFPQILVNDWVYLFLAHRAHRHIKRLHTVYSCDEPYDRFHGFLLDELLQLLLLVLLSLVALLPFSVEHRNRTKHDFCRVNVRLSDSTRFFQRQKVLLSKWIIAAVF